MEEEVLATGEPGVGGWNTEVSHPSKMIKAACYQLMRSLTLGVSLHADKMQQSAVTSSTSILRQVSARSSGVQELNSRSDHYVSVQVLQLGCQGTNCASPEHLLLAKDQHRGWASLGFIRAASLKSDYCRSMCTAAWVQVIILYPVS